MSVCTSWGCLKTPAPDQHIFSLWCWHKFLTCPALLEEGSCIKNHLESARGSWGRPAARKFAERAGGLACPLGDTAHSAQTQQGIGSLLSSQSGVPQVLLTRGSKPTLPNVKASFVVILVATLCLSLEGSKKKGNRLILQILKLISELTHLYKKEVAWHRLASAIVSIVRASISFHLLAVSTWPKRCHSLD